MLKTNTCLTKMKIFDKTSHTDLQNAKQAETGRKFWLLN